MLPPLFTRAQEPMHTSLADDAEASGIQRQLERELEPGGVRRRK